MYTTIIVYITNPAFYVFYVYLSAWQRDRQAYVSALRVWSSWTSQWLSALRQPCNTLVTSSIQRCFFSLSTETVLYNTATLAIFCTFNPLVIITSLSCVIPFVFLSCSHGSVASIACFLLQQCLVLPDPKWRSAVLNRGTAIAVNVKRMYRFTSGVTFSDRTNWIDCPIADSATSTLNPVSLVSSGAMPVYTVQKMEASLMQHSQVLDLLK